MQSAPQQNFSPTLKFVIYLNLNSGLLITKYSRKTAPFMHLLKSMGFLGIGTRLERASGKASPRYVECWVGSSASTKPFKVVVLFGTSDDRLLMRKCKQAVMKEKHHLEMGGSALYLFFFFF